METSQSRDGRGLWNNPRATQYSKKTQDLLRLMMQESKLTNLQRKQINECLKSNKSVQKRLPGIPRRRSAESCRSGNSYVREKFHPGPIRDSEKEKRRLQNILATGKEEPTVAAFQNVGACRNLEAAEQKDEYQEVLDEIEERRQFLADMTSLGLEKQYINIITTEISQRIRQLQVLDKARSPNKHEMTSERKGETAEQMTETIDLKEARGEKTHCH
ncbi:hypothetical protein FQN60_011706 [Etheostoma spectabile]|uniref:Uncharacterized protein n=1 Tax=Etheostoma spectabile TaxID=54343 RepID=A0A5J5DMG7_9PERO|nr:hypothetical protein FQN60_011706 [Etheostoma spectabile]